MERLSASDRQNYSELLKSAAIWLSKGKGMPVSVRDLCETLGIRVRRTEIAERAILVDTPGGVEIHLPKRSVFNVKDDYIQFSGRSRREAFERYWIAHELGHFLLSQAGLLATTNRREYYKQENIVDEFAQCVLLPTEGIEKWVTAIRARGEPESALIVTESMAEEAMVPWETAAQRMSTYYSLYWYFLIRQKSESSYRVVFSSLDRNRELHRIINKESPLGIIIRKLRRTITRLGPNELYPLVSNKSAVSAAGRNAYGSGIRIAVMGKKQSQQEEL
jgi:Zn-dependent peptidase ImmA (M78 family)